MNLRKKSELLKMKKTNNLERFNRLNFNISSYHLDLNLYKR